MAQQYRSIRCMSHVESTYGYYIWLYHHSSRIVNRSVVARSRTVFEGCTEQQAQKSYIRQAIGFPHGQVSSVTPQPVRFEEHYQGIYWTIQYFYHVGQTLNVIGRADTLSISGRSHNLSPHTWIYTTRLPYYSNLFFGRQLSSGYPGL